MGLLNFRLLEVDSLHALAEFHSTDHKSLPAKSPIIQWLPKDDYIEALVVMPDATEVKGLCESYCRNLKVDDRIQFVRFGFVRVDRVNDPMVFYYTHP